MKKEITIDAKELAELGRRMVQIREALGLKQKGFAAAVGFSEGYICQIEKGSANPTLDFFYILTSKLNVSLDFLFYGEGEMFYKARKSKTGLEENRDGIDTIDDILWYHEYSATFRNALLYNARKIYYDIAAYIEKDIDNERKKKKK